MPTIYEFLNAFNDLSNVTVRLFDCNSEDIVFDSRNYPDEDPVREVSFQGFDDYEIGGVDLYWDDGRIVLELNIEVDEEDGE